MPHDPAAARRISLGAKLREERVRQGRSQTDIAVAIGTNQKVVSRAELGRTTIDTQVRIAAELGVEVEIDLVAS